MGEKKSHLLGPGEDRKAGKTIIYTTVNDLSTHGGIETMIPQEIGYLRSKGYDINLLSCPPKGELRIGKDDLAGAEHYPKSFQGFPWLFKSLLSMIWFCRHVGKLAKEGKGACVSFSVIDGGGAALAKASGAKIRLVMRIVGPLSYEVQYFGKRRGIKQLLGAPIYRLIEAFTYIVSDEILPISELEDDNVRSYRIDEGKVRILRCGVDSSRYDGKRGTGPLKVPPGSKVVMFVGRFVEKNGPLVIAKAIPEVLKGEPSAVFVMVGDGPLMDNLRTTLAQEIEQGSVLMPGFRSDIPQLHAQANVYVGHVSSLVEGLGQTVFEAMMSGLPVVVGKDRISEKIVDDGKSGILVRKDDPGATAKAILTLLKDPERSRQIGLRARETALATLSFDSMMREVINSIDSG